MAVFARTHFTQGRVKLWKVFWRLGYFIFRKR